MDDQELSALIRTRATHFKASKSLRAAVVTHIALQSVAREQKRTLGDKIFGWLQIAGFGDSRVWVAFASGVLLTVAVVWTIPQIRSQGISDQDVVSLHVRAMGAGPLFEVSSSNRHTVKPWFQGKLDYAPEVVDLSEDGFELLGGRVDSVKGRPTAALVYTLRKHYFSVFQWPSESQQEPLPSDQRGFNVVKWSDGKMALWLVSDAQISELERFANAWRSRVAKK